MCSSLSDQSLWWVINLARVELMRINGVASCIATKCDCKTWPQTALNVWSRPGDLFIRKAVLEQGYLASQVAKFLACHPSNVSRALQK